jgi:Transcriptional regulator SbtR-like, C-terminal domain
LSPSEPGSAVCQVIEAMVSTGATKILLIGLLADTPGGMSDAAIRTSKRLRRAVGTLLRSAQQSGAVRPDVSVDDVYLFVRGLALATAQRPVKNATQRKAVEIVLAGLSSPSAHRRAAERNPNVPTRRRGRTGRDAAVP